MADHERKRESGRQCKEESSSSRSGLHGLLLGPLVFEALEEAKKPKPRTRLLSHPGPPLYPHPSQALLEPPRLSFLAWPRYPVPRWHTRSDGWTHPPLGKWYCLRGLLGSRLRVGSTGSRFLRAARQETDSKATTGTGRNANTAAQRGELLEVFLLPGMQCGRGSGEENHREERM